LPRLRASLR
jgi:hypothetical protein